MLLETVHVGRGQSERGQKLLRGPHFEHGGLYAKYFSAGTLYRLHRGRTSLLLSVSGNEKGRFATAFAPVGNDLPNLLGVHARFSELFGFELRRVRHVPLHQAAEVAQVLGAGWHRLPSTDPRHEHEDSWPQVEWKLSSLRSEEGSDIAECFPGPAYSSIREQCRRFTRKNGIPTAVSFDATKHSAVAIQLAMQTEEDRAVAKRIAGLERQQHAQAFGSIGSFLNQLSGGSTPYLGEMLFLRGEAVGLWIGGGLARRNLGVYVFLADRHLRAASQYCLAHAMCSARRKGYRTMCLGGSETEGLFRFKGWNLGNAFENHADTRQIVEFDRAGPVGDGLSRFDLS